MKIILVATGEKGRNVVFVTDMLKVYSLEEAVRHAKAGKFENVYAVRKGSNVYLRSSRNVPKKGQLEQLAISQHQLFNFANDTGSAVSHAALNRYLRLRESALKRREIRPYIYIGNRAHLSKRTAKKKLQEHKDHIFDAAKKFDVDPYLLAAIIIDELARFGLLDTIFDPLSGHFIGRDASAGIAQVTMETARGLIQDGYYNPDPSDPELSLENIEGTPRKKLYEYVIQPKHNIFFAAARMRALTDEWKNFIDISTKPEIIATLYSRKYTTPHSKPKPNERGLQISGEFYRLVREWLP